MLINGEIHSQIGSGLMVLFGVKKGDTEMSCGILADKLVNLRIFEDSNEKMNHSALDISAQIMIVSQFTLYADTRKGRRPAFTDAMPPSEAMILYQRFVELVEASGLVTRTGLFGEKMALRFVNDGPVTIILEHDSD